MKQLEMVGEMAAKTATYGGGTSAFIFGISASEFAAVVGATVGVLGYLTQLYFSGRRERREREEQEARMRRDAEEHAARMEQFQRERDEDGQHE